MTALTPSTSNVLAIDQGTSGTKALVVCPERGVIGRAEVPVRPTYDGALIEHDPAALLDSVLTSGNQAIAEAGEPVAAVGLANQGETVLAWDRASGRPLTPAIVWQDRRSATVTERLAPHANRLAELTGLELDPYFAAPKMAWLRENLTGDGVVTTSDVWLLNRLCERRDFGPFVTDAATASRTLLLDLDRVAWSGEALELFGLSGEQLPAVVDCAGPIGETTAFGDRAVPVTGLVVDQQAALYGQGCHAVGDAKCTFGTGAFLLANSGTTDAAGRARRSGSGLTTSVAWRLDGETTYCLDGQAYTVGAAVGWLIDIGVIDSATDLDAVGMTVSDAGGAIVVPSFTGLAAPWWRGRARGGIHGLGLGTTRAHLVRALIDGIAAQLAELVRTVGADLGRPLTSLRVDGGLTRSDVLMRTLADVAEVPIDVSATPDTTALGTAALAARGAGLPEAAYLSADAGSAGGATGRRFEPGPDRARAAETRERFRIAVAAVMDNEPRQPENQNAENEQSQAGQSQAGQPEIGQSDIQQRDIQWEATS